MIVDHEHHSSRFDRSGALLRDYIESAKRRTNIITLTEVGNNVRDNALRGHTNLGVAQVEGTPGQSECAIVYDRRFYELVRDPSTELLVHHNNIGGEDNVHMAKATFDTREGDRLKVGVYHGPAHIEGAFGFRKGSRDVDAHHIMMNSIEEIMQRWQRNKLVDGWMITGDLNLDYKKWWVRRYLNRTLPPYAEVNWKGNIPKGGTHFSRLIDMTFFAKMRLLSTHLAPDDASSDHRPFADAYLL